MDYANEGVLFPEASHLSGTSPPARAPAAAARAGAGGAPLARCPQDRSCSGCTVLQAKVLLGPSEEKMSGEVSAANFLLLSVIEK